MLLVSQKTMALHLRGEKMGLLFKRRRKYKKKYIEEISRLLKEEDGIENTELYHQ